MIIEDSYLDENNEIFKRLENKEEWITLSKYAYRFWTAEKDPSNVWEELIKYMWGDIIGNPDVAGFEYWGNVYDDKYERYWCPGWHQDKDEKLAETKRETICPKVSTVYYGSCDNLEGGFLEIALPEYNRAHNDDSNLTERIFPMKNRIVIFDPFRWHRVTPITNGIRYSFQVNIWEKPPSDAWTTYKDYDKYHVVEDRIEPNKPVKES